jgi:ribosomal protein S8
MKSIYFILFFSFFVILPCYSKGNNYLEIIKKESYFNDFKIIDDKVYIECKITIKNNTVKNIKYGINAIFKDDVRIGLLKNEILEGYNEDLLNNIFNISANETIKYQKIIFIGDFAGNYIKHDRALPKKINVILLE